MVTKKTPVRKTKATKKTTKRKPRARKPKASKVPAEYKDEEGMLRMPKDKFWNWKALHAQMELQQMRHSKAKADFEHQVQLDPRLNGLRNEQRSAKAELGRLVDEYNELLKQVGEETGLDMQKCSVDDVNGKIFEVDSEDNKN